MNSLADFPPQRFAIIAHCACGHSAVVDTRALPTGLAIASLQARLRCRCCDRHAAGIRITWTVAGGFKHGG